MQITHLVDLGFHRLRVIQLDLMETVFQHGSVMSTDATIMLSYVMTSSPRDRKALRGQQTWAQPLGWPLSHWFCWVVSEMVCGLIDPRSAVMVGLARGHGSIAKHEAAEHSL